MARAASRRALLTGAAASLIGTSGAAQTGLPSVRIGVLWDRSGPGAVTSGLDQLVAARLAVDDFGQFSRGYPIELVDAEFERRPDQAENIARAWFERQGVAVIVDVPGTAAPVQVQAIARAHDRSVMNTGSFNDALTGAACSPTATHWLEDTRALTMAMTLGLAAEGMKTWFLVAPDDVTGLALQTDATAAIEKTGGRVIGFARHPADADSFTQALGGALSAGADAIGLCAIAGSLQSQLREARRLGLFDKAQAVCAYAGSIRDIHAVGPLEARGLWLVNGFYWNQNDRTRAFSRRFLELTGRMPDKPYAATYAAVGHFLRIVETSDTIDGVALNVGLRGEPAYFFGANGRFRADGTLLLDVGLFQVKSPDQVAVTWDYYKQVRSIPAAEVFRVRDGGACRLAP